MKSVFETSNSIDANIVLNLLGQTGIDARIEGEYLQGGVGELQAIGIVRVVVSESEYDAAREIVAEWDSNQPAVYKKEPMRLNYSLISTLGGFAIGAALVMLFYKTPVTTDGIDYDGDGKLDLKWTYANQRISRTEIDRNFDRKVDYIARYDRRGLIESSSADDNFDGVFEINSRYVHEDMIWSEYDTTGDGLVDYRMEFKYGVLDKILFLNSHNRQPIKIQYFKNGKMVSSELDTNGDGVLDTAHIYDELEEIQSVRPLNTGVYNRDG
jgi:hypothetical protein